MSGRDGGTPFALDREKTPRRAGALVTTAAVLRVLVADDDRGFCAAAEVALAAHENVVVVGCAHTGLDAVALTAALSPDMVLLGLKMPLLDGLTVAETLRRIKPGTKVVIVTGSDDDSVAEAARNAGVAAFLRKDARLFENLDLTISLASVSFALFDRGEGGGEGSQPAAG